MTIVSTSKTSHEQKANGSERKNLHERYLLSSVQLLLKRTSEKASFRHYWASFCTLSFAPAFAATHFLA